jgi:hypothetical protein
MHRVFASAVLAVVVTTASPAMAQTAASVFELQAHVSGLFPGATIVEPVQVHNPQDYPVTVVSTEVLIADASAGCTASNLDASAVGGDVEVAAGSDAAVPVAFHMAADAPDACQGATFPLTFVATGTRPEQASGNMPWTGAGPVTAVLAVAGCAAFVVGVALARVRACNP